MTQAGSGAQLVVGGSVAALVAAETLVRRGRRVRLLLPNRNVGGGFTPLVRDGRRLERGIRVLELRYEGTTSPPPLADYVPGEQGHRPYTPLLDAWARELAGQGAVVEVDRAACWSNGRLGPEVLLSTDLTGACSLVSSTAAAVIAAEAEAAARTHGDAGLLDAGRRSQLWQMDLDEASVAQHGQTFHRHLLAPFCAKIRPDGGTDVLAALRRKLWVPLFWPRTVAEAFGGRDIAFRPDRPFTTVEPGGPGALVTALLSRLEASDQVEITRYDAVQSLDRGDAQTVRVTLSDGRSEVADRPVLGLPPGELFAAAGIAYRPARVRSVLVWLEAQEADLLALPGFVHVLDADVPAFRITPGERTADGSRVLCVELSYAVEAGQAAATATALLQRMGVVRESAELRTLGAFAGATFTDPTAENVEQFEAARGKWRARELPAHVIGGAGAFGSDAFNEQVVQGLHVAEAAA